MIADRLMRGCLLPEYMSRMPYPCWGLKFSEPISDAKELIELMTESRKDERWLLLGGPAAVSEGQLWTAWMGVASRFQNDTMRANTVDVEFIRLIAGTHQIQENPQELTQLKRGSWNSPDLTSVRENSLSALLASRCQLRYAYR